MTSNQSLESLLTDMISQDPMITRFPPFQGSTVVIQQQSLSGTRTNIEFTYNCEYNFSTTEFGRFYGYKTMMMFVGQVILENERNLIDLDLSLKEVHYQLKTNSDLSNSDKYIEEYKPFQDALFSTLARAIHESSEKGPPEFCQFDEIYVESIDLAPDDTKTYHIMYQFDHDGFSMYDKTQDFSGTVVVDCEGTVVSSNLETVRVGIGL